MIFFIALACGILFLVHLVVYKAVVSVLVIQSAAGLIKMRIIISLLGLSFISALFLTRKVNNLLSRIFYRISAVWIGLLFYFFLAACLYGLLGAHFGIILFSGAALVSIYGVYNATKTKIISYDVTLPHLPESWKGKRAVFFSDMHLGQVRGKRFAQKVATLIESLHPDIIFNTGDLFDGVKVNAPDIIEPFLKLKPRNGFYFVAGNHEEFFDSSEYINAIKDAGIRVLADESVVIEGVQIVGVDYQATHTSALFKAVLEKIPFDTKVPSNLLKHVPDNLDVAMEKGMSLQLSGHTHRAQMYPLSFITKRMFKGFDYGLKRLQGMQVITTSGVGTWGPPLRVGTHSEIICITFS